MSKVLIVVDMQNDFISGSLGTAEARKIVPKVVEKIKSFNDVIICTKDVHTQDYLRTHEGINLPVEHCMVGTNGCELVRDVHDVLNIREYLNVEIDKRSFGSLEMIDVISGWFDDEVDGELLEIELVGVCTDICVVSNALLLRSRYPEAEITVDASCCAGSTPEKHKAALEVMRSCHINIING